MGLWVFPVSRRWVVGRLLPSLDRHCQRELLSAELQVCSRCAAAHPKLYYAWNYRLWLCQHMDLDMVRWSLRVLTFREPLMLEHMMEFT